MNNKIALITGGSRGLGKSSALHLAKHGINVIITYNTKKEDAENVVSEIQKMGLKSNAIQLNISKFSAIDPFIKDFNSVLQSWGVTNFDYLINNAGIGATIPFSKVTEEDFDNFCNIHFKGVYFLTQKLLNNINDNGRIINVSSGTTRFCVPGYSVYASMKGAIEVFTRYLAKDLGSKGITVNVLTPGPVETDFNNASIRNNPQMKGFLAQSTALGRVGESDDIGKILPFLCSEDSQWINGQRIEASGGINL